MPRKNKELEKEYNKNYHATHREKILSRHKINAQRIGITKHISEYQKAWRESHKDEIKEYQRDRKSKNTDKNKNRNQWLKQAYGITLDEYNDLLESQENSCLVCGKQKDKKSLPVDHEHITGYDEMLPEQKRKYIRGILCKNCNQALGLVNDNIEILENMIIYLQSYKNKNYR